MPSRSTRAPWFHEASGFWCTQLNGKRHYLDRDLSAANRKLKSLLAKQRRQQAGESEWLDVPFAELAGEFLSDIKARRAEGTYDQCRYCLLRAIKILGTDVRVNGVRRIHLARIEQAMNGEYSPTTIRDTLSKVQQVFAWAVEHDLLESSPIARYRKPAARSRNRIITAGEFRAMLRACAKNPAFRRVLVSMRLLGCRPSELRKLTWDMVDLDEALWILPKHKTVTTQRKPRPRVISLPDPMLRLCRWLNSRCCRTNDHVYLNMHGRPYTKDMMVKVMDRIRRRAKIGLKGGEQIVLYSNRHTFGTEAAGRITDIELAELMGHTDTQTTRRYVHLNTARLRDIRGRVTPR